MTAHQKAIEPKQKDNCIVLDFVRSQKKNEYQSPAVLISKTLQVSKNSNNDTHDSDYIVDVED